MSNLYHEGLIDKVAPRSTTLERSSFNDPVYRERAMQILEALDENKSVEPQAVFRTYCITQHRWVSAPFPSPNCVLCGSDYIITEYVLRGAVEALAESLMESHIP